MGHKLSGVRNSYSRPSNKQLREAYVDAYTHLRVYPIPATEEEMKKQAEELRKAKAEVQELRNKMQTLEEDSQRIQKMFKKMTSAVLGSETALKFHDLKTRGKDKLEITLGLPEKDIERLRRQTRKYGQEKTTRKDQKYKDVVKVDKHDIDAIVELLKQGYKKAFENEKYAVFAKE